jgi:tetratricopeptide (TPR) repeat protein
MATATRITGKANPPTSPASVPAAPGEQKPSFTDRAGAWISAHRTFTYWTGAIIAVAVALFLWTLASQRKTEEIAGRDLANARFAFDNQNLPLARSELAKLVADYSGTNAAEEGRLLLANVWLVQGQPQQAVTVLQEHAGSAARPYRAQAYSLLGAAYENMGRTREAAQAYENGSDAARLDFLKAQLLDDAGRAWTTAGDTTKALADYRRVVKDFSKEAGATEARVRLAELTKGAQ